MVDGSKSGIIGGDDREKRRKAELYATDQQVRDARPLEAVTEAIERSGVPLAQIVATIMAGYADRPALGERVTELVTDPATGRCSRLPLPRFDTISYRELWARAGAIASMWRQHTDSPLRVGEFVGVLGFASADYVMVDLACVRLGAVSVPLQASASARQLMPIIGETEPRILASSAQLLDTAVECALRSTSVRRVIVFGYHPDVDDERERFDAARERLAGASTPIALESLTEVIGCGQNLPPVSLFEGQDGRLAMLLYTSGSTGTPKGARYTDHVMRLLWHRTWRPRPIDLPMISVVYTPLSHLVGQTILLSTLAAGGTAYFPGKSDLSTLFEDFRRRCCIERSAHPISSCRTPRRGLTGLQMSGLCRFSEVSEGSRLSLRCTARAPFASMQQCQTHHHSLPGSCPPRMQQTPLDVITAMAL